jgi:hypothetical protein
MLRRATAFLPLVQLVLAVTLLVLGNREKSNGIQDGAPFVPVAVRVCEAINAPAVILAVAVLPLLRVAHLTLGASEVTAGEAAFVCEIAFLWFLIDLQIERLRHRAAGLSGLSALLVSISLALAAVLALFATSELRQGEVIVGTGAATWAFILAVFYGMQIIRLLRATLRPEH